MPARSGSRSEGRYLTGWLKSASIWTTMSASRAISSLNAATYARPRPCLARRCSTAIAGLRPAISSASSPVPSGDPSSTIRTWASGTVPRIASVTGPTFSRSLYVGTMIQMVGLTGAIDFLAAGWGRGRGYLVGPLPRLARCRRRSTSSCGAGLNLGSRRHENARRNRSDRTAVSRVPAALITASKKSEDLSLERRTALRPLPELPQTLYIPTSAVHGLLSTSAALAGS